MAAAEAGPKRVTYAAARSRHRTLPPPRRQRACDCGGRAEQSESALFPSAAAAARLRVGSTMRSVGGWDGRTEGRKDGSDALSSAAAAAAPRPAASSSSPSPSCSSWPPPPPPPSNTAYFRRVRRRTRRENGLCRSMIIRHRRCAFLFVSLLLK